MTTTTVTIRPTMPYGPLVRSTAFDVVVVDSVPGLEPPQQADAAGRGSRGARQGRLMSEALRRLAAGVDRTRTVLLFGNRTATERQNEPGDEAPGGRALRFYASVRVGLKRREILREHQYVVGSRVEVTTVKNKMAPPLRVTELDLMYGEGFIG